VLPSYPAAFNISGVFASLMCENIVWWHRLTANRETHALEMIGSIPSATLRNSSSSMNMLIEYSHRFNK
jgi:hypothetical protein